MNRETCEVCGRVCDGAHGSAIGGGGFSPLCPDCASRLCACGAVVLDPKGQDLSPECMEVPSVEHKRERCTHYGITPGSEGEILEAIDRPAGCPCDACRERAEGGAE